MTYAKQNFEIVEQVEVHQKVVIPFDEKVFAYESHLFAVVQAHQQVDILSNMAGKVFDDYTQIVTKVVETHVELFLVRIFRFEIGDRLFDSFGRLIVNFVQINGTDVQWIQNVALIISHDKIKIQNSVREK